MVPAWRKSSTGVFSVSGSYSKPKRLLRPGLLKANQLTLDCWTNGLISNHQSKHVTTRESCIIKRWERNVIIYLGTGLGKTFITVLFLNSALVAEQISLGRKVVFMAPTQDLVKQQAEYIFGKVPYKVRVYCGRTCYLGIHIDRWKESEWNKEFANIDILFMTPQIFASAISTALIKWSQISSVIFDECHHASTTKKEKLGKGSGHPYSQVLKHFKQIGAHSVEKPRFIGLTASLVNSLPKDASCIRSGIWDLERKFDAKCVTDLTAIEFKPKFLIYSFSKPMLDKDNDVIVRMFTHYAKILEEALAISKLSKIQDFGPDNDEERDTLAYYNRLRLASSGFSIKPASFHKVLRQLSAIRVNCGLWHLANICYLLFLALGKHSKSSLIPLDVKSMYVDFAAILWKVVETTNDFLGSRPEELLLEYSQPKLIALLEVLKSQYLRATTDASGDTKFSCIVFVKSRVEVVALYGWLRSVSETIPDYHFIKANYAIGLAATMASKYSCITKRKSTDQTMMLEDFRNGELNVIVTTSVLEEGIDLPVCSTVIRYDHAETFRVYVQSRGRARQKSSYFVALCHSDKQAEAETSINKYNDFEVHVKKYTQGAGEDGIGEGSAYRKAEFRTTDGQEDAFTDLDKQIHISPSQATISLNMYFSRLSHRCPYSEGLLYERKKLDDGMIKTTLTFPPGCPIKDSVSGAPRKTISAADSSAIIEAFRILYESKELDEHGVPIRITEEHIDSILSKYKLKPDFSPVDPTLEGEVQLHGEREVFVYPWKLFNLSTCLARVRKYKLYRINFKATSSEQVRRETRPYFEKSTFGLIVDSAREHFAWPDKLFSHYGEFLVEYQLLNGDLRFSHHGVHRDYTNYTLKLATQFWNFERIRREDFKERCQFYIVPLDENNKIDDRALEQSLRCRPLELHRGSLVKKNPFYLRHKESQGVYVIKTIHWDMRPSSLIPGRRESFLEQAIDRHGELIVRDFDQPIIEVVPIARQIASQTPIKKKGPEYSSSSEFFMAQVLDTFLCDLPTAYQAYNLPPIIHRIYLASLAAELDDTFMQATHLDRRNYVRPEPVIRCDPETISSESEDENEGVDGAKIDSIDDGDLADPSDEVSCDEEEDIYQESEEGDETEEELSTEDDSDSPISANIYRDILSKQKFELAKRDRYDEMEKWDLSEYTMSDSNVLSFEREQLFRSQKYIDSNPKYFSTFANLEIATVENITKIKEALSRFRMGIRGTGEYPDDELTYERPGGQVDLSKVPPIKFDRAAKPAVEKPRDVHFLEALTQRRAGERHNLEALENIGDSYLKYSVSVVLFRCLDKNEGDLTMVRSRLVGNKYFHHLAKKAKLGFYAITNKFDPSVLAAAMGARVVCENKLREKDLADIFESLIGACLVYRGEFEAIMAMKWLGLDIFTHDSFSELHEGAVIFSKPDIALPDLDESSRDYLRQCQTRVGRFQKIINYKFSNLSYLVQAFTHASAFRRCTDSYERLEFLGDAILDCLITMTLYDAGYTTDPGQLTSSRSALVNNCTFAKLAIKYKYDLFIQHANQELFDELSELNLQAQSDSELSFLDDFRFDKITKTLADVFEAVAGAIYIDSGCSLDTVYSVYYPIMKETIDEEIKEPTKNIVAQLFEMFPGKDRINFTSLKSKTSVDDGGESSSCVKLTIFGLEPFYGEGSTVRLAKKRAVASALANLPSEEERKRLNEVYIRILEARGDLETRRAGQGRGRGRARGCGRGRGRGRGPGGRGGRGARMGPREISMSQSLRTRTPHPR